VVGSGQRVWEVIGWYMYYIQNLRKENFFNFAYVTVEFLILIIKVLGFARETNRSLPFNL
jgi:hypothetical protein